MENIVDQLNSWLEVLGPFGPWITAIIILIVGSIVCKIIAKGVELGLRKSKLDDQVSNLFKVENANAAAGIAKLAYYLLLLFVLVVALGATGMGEQVTEPLNELLNGIAGFLPNIIGAAIFGFVAFVIATIVKNIVQGALTATKIDEKLELGPSMPITSAVSNVVFGLVILVLLPGVLQVLAIDAVSVPIEGLVTKILDYLPNLFAGGILIAIGIFIASIVKKVLGSALESSGVNNLPQKLGHNGELRFMDKSLSEVISLIVMVTMLVFVIGQGIRVMDMAELSSLASLIKKIWGGILILMIGLFFAGLAKKAIAPKSPFWASTCYVALVVFVGGMALQAAELTDLSDLTIQYVVLGGTVAAVVAFGIGGAIAIGLGGKESVARFLEKKTKD